MKQWKRVKRRGKVTRLQASAGGRERPPGPMPEWLAYYKPIKKAVTCGLGEDFVSGTRGVKAKPKVCDQSATHPSQKAAKDGAPSVWFTIGRLGHPPRRLFLPRMVL